VIAIEHARLFQELEERTAALAHSNADLEQFAYVASHDLQEPLRVVGSYVQLLARRYEGQLDDRADRYINRSVAAVERMRTLINDLLAYSRVGTRGRVMVPTETANVLNHVLEGLAVTIRETAAEITWDPLPTVRADATQLGQLLQNLLGNALKYRGERPPRIHVAVERQGQRWQFAVRDNGIGIDPEYAERIFLVFQRLHTRDEYPGTGIGLAICQKIVERHGGQLLVDSQVGQGATFSFTLPAVEEDEV
jgi:light-regulated signal transduction histidine kinase (bacteriophytochrome)